MNSRVGWHSLSPSSSSSSTSSMPSQQTLQKVILEKNFGKRSLTWMQDFINLSNEGKARKLNKDNNHSSFTDISIVSMKICLSIIGTFQLMGWTLCKPGWLLVYFLSLVSCVSLFILLFENFQVYLQVLCLSTRWFFFRWR